MNIKVSALCLAMLSVGLVACSDDNKTTAPTVEETTPESINLSLLGRYETGIFAESAAEIPAYDATTKRIFVVNAKKGLVDVLDVSKPETPYTDRCCRGLHCRSSSILLRRPTRRNCL